MINTFWAIATLGDKQRELYGQILARSKEEIAARISEHGISKSQMTILARMTHLRQVCCDPRLLSLVPTSVPSAKLALFFHHLEHEVWAERKVVVFSQFVEMQKLLVEELTQRGIPHLWIHGGTKNREEIVAQFQAPMSGLHKGENPVLIVSIKAGGPSLNLSAAHTVMYYDPWWFPTPSPMSHHQLSHTRALHFVCEDTVEQRVLVWRHRRVFASPITQDEMGFLF